MSTLSYVGTHCHSGGHATKPLNDTSSPPPSILIPQDPLLHGALGPCSHQEDDEDGEDEGSGRLEAAAAASTLCLEMRAGAWLRRDSKLAKLYPAWADMTRGTVHVDTSSRWGQGQRTPHSRPTGGQSLCCRVPSSTSFTR